MFRSRVFWETFGMSAGPGLILMIAGGIIMSLKTEKNMAWIAAGPSLANGEGR
jgi:hypothetical protein